MADGNWLEVTVLASAAQVEPLEEWLFEAGALSVTLLDAQLDDDLTHAVLEPVPGEVRLWQEVSLVGLFSRDTTPDVVHDCLHLAAAQNALNLPPYRIEMLAEQEWTRTWMDSFKPMQFGSRFWICPSTISAPDPDAIILRLDPGLAFGTGTHATTAQCLAWMGEQTNLTDQPLAGKHVIDYGCGSGVLAIAALLLGATKAIAVDIDEQALLATNRNALQNGVHERLVVGQPSVLNGQQADILLANILFKPLMSLADTLAQRVSSGGRLVLSGILEEQMEPLRLRYNDSFAFEPGRNKDGWALMSATRR